MAELLSTTLEAVGSRTRMQMGTDTSPWRKRVKAIAEPAARGNEISLNGFGKFKIKDSPEREGRNPAPVLPWSRSGAGHAVTPRCFRSAPCQPDGLQHG